MSKQILSPHGSFVSVAKIDTSAISAAVWEVSVGANWYCYTATEQRANHLRQLLSEHPQGAYPAPRDARTDKPKESDANKTSQVLAAGLDGEWFSTHYGNVMPGRYQRWLPMPPPIPEQKSELQSAWDASELSSNSPIPTKDFVIGFNAAKKGGGA